MCNQKSCANIMIRRTADVVNRTVCKPDGTCSAFESDSTDTSVVENCDPNCAPPCRQNERIAKAAAVLKRHYRQAFDVTDEVLSRKRIQRQGVSVKACSSECCLESRCFPHSPWHSLYIPKGNELVVVCFQMNCLHIHNSGVDLWFWWQNLGQSMLSFQVPVYEARNWLAWDSNAWLYTCGIH